MKYISSTKIELNDYQDLLHHPKAGASVIFCGDIRNHNLGEAVDSIFFEAQEEMANTMIGDILKEANKKWELHESFCVHRVGEVAISETAVIVITGASHRKGAYEANEWILDQVKFNAPIWKKERFSSGVVKWGHNSEDTPLEL